MSSATSSSKYTKVAFYGVTGLFVLGMLPGAVLDLVQPDFVLESIAVIKVSPALLTLLGVWKILGALAFAVPGYPRVKEWAYAGFFFDLVGAAWLHFAEGDYGNVAPPLAFLALLVASYLLRGRVQAAASGSAQVSEGTRPAST